MMSKNVIQEKSFQFSIQIIRICGELSKTRKEFVLSKQLIRSGTSVGALVRESAYAESRRDFVHKLGIALKEINETIYWLDLLNTSEILSDKESNALRLQANEIRKILSSIILTTKQNGLNHS